VKNGMKIKSSYIMIEVAGTHVVVPTGEAALDFSGMITLNGTGVFLWKQLEQEKTERELLSVLLEEYKVDETEANTDISEFLAKLKAADLFE